MHATGPFDVKIIPQEPTEKVDWPVGRMSIDKQFHGDLEASSKGEMLTSSNESSGSRAYVAIELVSGTLGGRAGTFVLMHSASMTRDGHSLEIRVAPGSGTAGFAGIEGKMSIEIVDKKHFYMFDYSLPE